MEDWIIEKALRESLVVKAESFPKSVTVVKPCLLENGVDFAVYVPRTALDRASKFAADMSGTCPYDMFGFRAKDCDAECDDSYAECWRRYFETGGDSR